jgi:peptide/nickel transport system substrate-binding protein
MRPAHLIGLAGIAVAAMLSASAPAAAQPTGKLTIGLSSIGTAEQWLPWLESGREGWLGLEPVYESLVSSDPKTGAFLPQIAERWQIEDGGRRWRFHLRKGVRFHDGSELTAPDVVFSHEQMVSQKSVASASSVLRSLVERIEVIGPHEIVYHLRQPDVTFLGRVGTTLFGVVSKGYVERVGEKEAAAKPIGTGPYRMVEHRRQQSVVYEAVENHYLDKPGFKTVVLRRVPDQSARLAMLRSREIDITEIPFRLKREAEAANLKVFRVSGAAVYHIQLGGQLDPKREQFDKTVPWVADPNDPASAERARKVRRAMNLAVDKRAIIRAVFEGEGAPAISPFFPPDSEFNAPGTKPVDFDPKEAKRLLAEAGYPNGFSREIEMLLMPWPGRAEMADVAEVVAGFWEKNLGLKVRRRPIDWATFAPNYGASRKMSWVSWAHGFNPRVFPDPINGMDSWLMTSSRYNSVGEYPEVDAIAGKVRAEVDDKKRVDLYRQMAKVFVDNHYAVPIASVPALYAYNDKRIASWDLPRGEAYISGYHRAVPVK